MNPLLRSTFAFAQKISRRLKEKAGLVSGFSDIEMQLWMLNDEIRVEAYEKAILRGVKEGDVVVDVGAGTGLLSMLACRAGARRVYAIEETRIIDLARSLAKDNGYEQRITFLRGNSRKLELPERADAVVTETIGSFVFSEEIVSTLEDARARFLKPGGVLIPERVTVFLAPIESFEEGVGLLERPIRGLDFRHAAVCLARDTVTAARKIERRHYLDEPRAVYDIDFKTVAASMSFDRTLCFTARREGTLHGFVGSWSAILHGDVVLACDPAGPPVTWPPLLFRLPESLPVRAGDRITLHFTKKDRPGWSWTWQAQVSG